jgi:hypothetical protein
LNPSPKVPIELALKHAVRADLTKRCDVLSQVLTGEHLPQPAHSRNWPNNQRFLFGTVIAPGERTELKCCRDRQARVELRNPGMTPALQ